MDRYVERDEREVLRIRADRNGGGPAAAMQRLESKLPSLKGRNFYGALRLLPEGEEHFAYFEKLPGDDPDGMGLEPAKIPGGLYVRRKILDWESVIAAGRLGTTFRELARSYEVDSSRPEIEYYRSAVELHLLVPVAPGAAAHPPKLAGRGLSRHRNHLGTPRSNEQSAVRWRIARASTSPAGARGWSRRCLGVVPRDVGPARLVHPGRQTGKELPRPDGMGRPGAFAGG